MYILLSGSLPFKGTSKTHTLSLILKGKYDIEKTGWESVSQEAKSLIVKLLEINPKKRITAKEALNSQWISGSRTPNIRGSLIESAANNIKNFSETHKLQRAVIRFIASQLLTQNEKNELVSIFKSIDKTGEGKINEEELLAYCNKVFGNSLSEEDVHNIMVRVDTDNSGFIDYSEFLAAAMDKKKLLSEEKLKATFNAFDRDNNGKITAQELKYVLESDTKLDIKAYTKLIEQVDLNGDGMIDFREFQIMMSSLIKP
jgi:calcium-dependent protein kinase